MSDLYDALAALGPRDFTEVPHDLTSFLKQTFSAASTIVDSLPQPPPPAPGVTSSVPAPSQSNVEGDSSRPTPNFATKATEIIPSATRAPTPTSFDADTLAQLIDKWGRPVKVAPRDNPASVSVWKMAGHDRRGAWFARRSVHEGLGFAKWRKAMKWEFEESLAVEGKPGEGSIRGIGADRRLERQEVEGVGKLEVYQLAAQFPRPTAPREFITMLLTTDTPLSTLDEPSPRQFTMVSIPVNHHDAPPREGLVRGQYESIEMIREIRRSPLKSASDTDLTRSSSDDNRPTSRGRGKTIGFAESRGEEAKGEKVDTQSDDEAELNPVEWIMITRSDPGGGIPRFMVERNTPASITADAGKFLDWATSRHDFPSTEGEEDSKEEPDFTPTAATANGHLAGVLGEPSKDREAGDGGEQQLQSGILDTIKQTVGDSITAYAPAVIQDNLPTLIAPRRRDSDSTETSSLTSFASAEQFSTAPDGLDPTFKDPLGSPSSISLRTPDSVASPSPSDDVSSISRSYTAPHDKELAKLTKKREQLEAKLAKARVKDEQEKAKAESKYERDLAKLEARREKELRKLAARQKKIAEQDVVNSLRRERDEWRQHAEMIRKENALLKEQVGELQKENTVLVQRMGKTEEGRATLKGIREDLKRVRAGSTSSGRSVKSSVN